MTYQGVKFTTKFLSDELPCDPRLDELKMWCQKFNELKLAPPYEGGSSGNLSFRIEEGRNQFIITGSRVSLGNILADSFVKVESVDFEKGLVFCHGQREPSSESMLHFAIYQKRPEINAVFHGHSPKILSSADKLKITQTKKEEPYGTSELVQSVLDVLKEHNFLIMKNHGFLALGKAMREAGELTFRYNNQSRKNT